MNIAILGCGKIAHRIALGIMYSNGTLYAIASRDKARAKAFAEQYRIPHSYNYEECLADDNVDIVYIATANPTHYELIEKCLKHKKHVICEKPMVASAKEVEQLFTLAKANNCFLMEAHKTCFTPLNELIKARINEIGPITSIQASYCGCFPIEGLSEWNVEANMGGSFYDVGVYPLIFSLLYANSDIKDMSFEVSKYQDFECDFECTCKLEFENGICASIESSWAENKVNKGIIKGEKGCIEILNYWKNTEALIIINDQEEHISVQQDSDFTGEINHAINCIKEGILESPILSMKQSMTLAYVCERMKAIRDKI